MITNKKIRVLHVIGNMGQGGAQSLLWHLWPSLCLSEQFEFEICTLYDLGHFGKNLVSESRIIHCLNGKNRLDIQVLIRLRKLIQSNNYGIVHAHLFPELYLAPLATHGFRNIKLIYTEHTATNRRWQKAWLFKWLDRPFYNRYAKIIAVNRSTQQNLTFFQPQLAHRVSIINNAVKVCNILKSKHEMKSSLIEALKLDIATDTTLILFAGRLTYQKGVDILIKALSMLTNNNFFCLIAGDGPDRVELQELVKHFEMDEKIIFLGNRSDVLHLLQSVDFMVLPSRWEGLPIIILEAMACGCPIIASAVDGTAEVLENDASAILVTPQQPCVLAKAISKFIENPQLRSKLAVRAQKIVNENFSTDQVTHHLLELYNTAMINGETSL